MGIITNYCDFIEVQEMALCIAKMSGGSQKKSIVVCGLWSAKTFVCTMAAELTCTITNIYMLHNTMDRIVNLALMKCARSILQIQILEPPLWIFVCEKIKWRDL
jgi:hypothetical protein